MDNGTEQLLVEALAPYNLTLGAARPDGGRLLVLEDERGEVIIRRVVRQMELNDRLLLTDVVDGIRRDLLVLEGRIESVLATLFNTGRSRPFAAL
ncbi:MAG: DUF3509 domain-containing protein [Pseudomonas sp.]